MRHPVIPAPLQLDPGGRAFVVRSGTPVAYTGAELQPLVERFRADVARRTGVQLEPVTGEPQPGTPALRVSAGDGSAALDEVPRPRGVAPMGGAPVDERHSLTIDGDGIVVRATTPEGAARGLTTLLQLVGGADPSGADEVTVPGGRIVDAPRYAWRGLSLDVARAWYPVDELRRVVDLLALYKLNVLHLHLTDDQAWRLPCGRRDDGGTDDFYAAADLRSLVDYAADRFVTVVPEVDTPGHSAALVRLRPELDSGRNEGELEMPPGHRHRAVWLDPELPATFAVMDEVIAGVADIFPSPYLHIGGDEPWGMPHELYAAYVDGVRGMVRSLGKRPLGWQECARAGLGPDDFIQYWFADIPLPPSLPAEVRRRVDEELAQSRGDAEAAAAASVPVLVSPLGHCYLDVPYADLPADPAQAERRRRLGLRLYSPKTLEASFAWDPAEVLGPGRDALVAGVEAAMWAESITGFDDLTFLLLPRLPGVAAKAWSDPAAAPWPDHRDRLASHGRLWAQDGLTYFRASTVDWQ